MIHLAICKSAFHIPTASAILGRKRAVRMLEMRLTLWLSRTCFPDMGTTSSLATSVILPVLTCFPEN